jgi:cell division transport system permease protein
MGITLKSLRRSPYQTLGIFFALTFSFLILLFFSSSIMVLSKIVDHIQSQPQVTIYFLKTTPESDIYKLREKLLETQKVKKVDYISQDKALTIYKNLNKDEPLLLEMVNKESLPPSLEAYTLKPEYLTDIAKIAEKEPGVEEVAFQKDIIDSLINVTNSIRLAAIVFLSAQFLIVFFIIFTTITYKIVAKKEEIEIMRLLGASRYFITRPFLKQNLLINLLAVLTSSAIFVGTFLIFIPRLQFFLTGIPSLNLFQYSTFSINLWPPNAYFFMVLSLITFVIGYVLIWLTTSLAASKYIK